MIIFNNIDTHKRYTCPNSSLVVEILAVKSSTDTEAICHLRYFTIQGRFIGVECNQRLVKDRISHWEEYV